MKGNKSRIAVSLLLVCGAATFLGAHCQVPCGIYDDEARFKALFEHITTIEKAMKETVALSAQSPVNYNQVVRWVMNKEKHAEEFSEILSHYFLAQRLVPKAPEDGESRIAYLEQLELCHRLIVLAMKAKQTVDLGHVQALRDLLAKLQSSYFKKK
jgi:nickel superoxide dismutase